MDSPRHKPIAIPGIISWHTEVKDGLTVIREHTSPIMNFRERTWVKYHEWVSTIADPMERQRKQEWAARMTIAAKLASTCIITEKPLVP